MWCEHLSVCSRTSVSTKYCMHGRPGYLTDRVQLIGRVPRLCMDRQGVACVKSMYMYMYIMFITMPLYPSATYRHHLTAHFQYPTTRTYTQEWSRTCSVQVRPCRGAVGKVCTPLPHGPLPMWTPPHVGPSHLPLPY